VVVCWCKDIRAFRRNTKIFELISTAPDSAAGDQKDKRWALGTGHVDVAQMLVERGADVSAQAEDGTTPLHLASSKGHVDVARILVERGADVSAQAEDGTTPLHLASSKGHVDVAQILVEHGAYGQPIQFDSHS